MGTDTFRVDPARWRALEELFHAAVLLPPAQRAAYLDAACGDDAVMRREVERLLAADADPHAALSDEGQQVSDRAMQALEAELHETSPRSLIGRSVGPYRVIEQIGRGGMGVVYLAEREDVQKRVALKVVRATLGAPELVRRFLVERRVLARLVHPGIARLLDAGMADDTTPWLAMDLVEGAPITRYCDDNALDLDGRLRLFLEVCDAVAYAHAQLVVHRDIKPSNVLVDAEGRVKLLDFGIAKLLGEDEADGESTRTGMRVFSPEYAAPEQVMGEPVTTSTDVHALGVLLFELLSGERPYLTQGSSPAAAARALMDTEPRRLSAVARGSRSRDSITTAFDGDLDAICLRALARDPADRYRSAQQLADDVARYRDGYPIEARLPTARYRAAKFLRRNRATVAAGALVVLALGGGLGASLWQGERARTALQESQEVEAFLAGLFEASNPAENRGRNVDARELLESGVTRIEELGGRPRVQARMLEVIARAYHGLGESETARELGERALEQRRALLGNDHADVATTLHTLGETLDELGDREASVARFREALEIRRRTLGPEDDLTTLTMIRLARMLMLTGEIDQAEAMAREARDIRRAVHGPRHRETAPATEALGLILGRARTDREQGELLLREALAIREEAFGPDDPRIDRALLPLATLISEMGKVDEGERLVRRSIEIQRRVFGPDHPGLAYRLGNLGYVLGEAGKRKDAEAVYRDVLRRFQELYPGDYPYTATTLNNLGAQLSMQGQLDSAIAYQTQARDMYIRLYGEETPDVALAYHNIAGQFLRLRRLAEAEESIRKAYALREKIYGEHGASTLRTGSIMGAVLAARAKHAEAEAVLAEIRSRQQAADPVDRISLARTTERLAAVVEARGRPDEAARLRQEAAATRPATAADTTRCGSTACSSALRDRDRSGEHEVRGPRHPVDITEQERIP